MNRFRQHIPSFVDTSHPPREFQFETTEELDAYLRSGWMRPDFSHFAKSGYLILEVSDEGRHWWVLGSVSDPTSVDYPEWDEGVYRVEWPDGRVEDIPGDRVAWSRGDNIELKDGTRARWRR